MRFDLTSDLIFRTLFTRYPASLIDLLNSILDFQEENKIQNIDILPSEMLKEYPHAKVPILDIKAISESGRLFNVEMQAFSQPSYASRILYYWARLFSGQLSRGNDYSHLADTYSINFLNFSYIKKPGYKSTFLLLEKDAPHIQLTEKLQIVFLELPKFKKSLKKIDDNLELWLYIMTNTSLLDEEQMWIIIDKNPTMEETLVGLRKLSLDPKLLSVEEARRKAELDYNSMMNDKFRKGIAEGRTEGMKKGKTEGREEGLATAARRMKLAGEDIKKIAVYTGLSVKDIEKL